MNTRILTLAHSATLAGDGVNMLSAGVGGFGGQWPANIGVTLVGLFEYSASEAGELRPYKVIVLDADGRTVLGPLEGPLEFPESDLDGPHVPSQTGFITRLSIPIEKAGDYAVEVTIGGHMVGRVPFAAIELQVPVGQ